MPSRIDFWIIRKNQICCCFLRLLSFNKHEIWDKTGLFPFDFKPLEFLTCIIKSILKQKIFINKLLSISIIFFGMLFIIQCHFEKQNKSQINEVYKFLNNYKYIPIVPQLLLWLNDNEVIYNVGLGCESESIDQGTSYIDKNINISNCFFSRYSHYSGDGGVIYVNGGSYSMNIICSMFYNCVCNTDGGAIYFRSLISCLRMICANRCSCGILFDPRFINYYYGLFSYLVTSQENQVEYLSVSKCSHISSSGFDTIYLSSGYQRVVNTNSSMNNAKKDSGISINNPSSFTSSYCTFSHNYVSNCVCIYFCSDSGTISLSYANIVHNNSPSQYGVVSLWGTGPRKMMFCIFQNNHDYLFCVYQGSLEVLHSFIDHTGSFSTSIAVSTSNNNSFTSIITYQLQFFNSLHCNADMPLPQRSSEETLRMTNERTINQSIGETLKDTNQSFFADCMCSNQMANKREISFIFAFISFVIG